MPEAIHVMGLVPDELLSNIKRGDCVLFLGADTPFGMTTSVFGVGGAPGTAESLRH